MQSSDRHGNPIHISLRYLHPGDPPLVLTAKQKAKLRESLQEDLNLLKQWADEDAAARNRPIDVVDPTDPLAWRRPTVGQTMTPFLVKIELGYRRHEAALKGLGADTVKPVRLDPQQRMMPE